MRATPLPATGLSDAQESKKNRGKECAILYVKAFRTETRKIETHLDFSGKNVIFSVNLFQGIQPLSCIEGFYAVCSAQTH